jgi:nucleotide-binding universal stress UspA family protein
MSDTATPPSSATPSTLAYRRVVIAIDSDPLSHEVVRYVARFVTKQTAVRIVTSVADPRALMPAAAGIMLDWAMIRDELRTAAQAALGEASALSREYGIEPEVDILDLAMIGARAPDALQTAADTWGADLLAIGSHRRNALERLMMGPSAAPVVRRSHCPVLLLPEHAAERRHVPPLRIMVAIDGSPTSRLALREAPRLAGPHTQFHVVYMIDRAVRFSDVVPIDALYRAFVEEGERALADANMTLLAHRCEGEATVLETHRINDDVPHALVRESETWQADLLVMGTHGRRGPARWFLGSVAERVVRLAALPLLLVRHPGLAA